MKLTSKFSFLISTGLHFCLLMLLTFLNNKFKNEYSDVMKMNTQASKVINSIKIDKISLKELNEIKKQIVHSEDSQRDLVDKSTKYSSDKNRSFDRQTRARVVAQFQKGASSSQKSKKAGNDSATVTFEKLTYIDIKNNEVHKLPKTKELTLKPQNVKKSTLKQVSINSESLQKYTGESYNDHGVVASSNDFVEDIPLGDFTRINTTENKYFGFYNRIRERLEKHWGSTIKNRARTLYKKGRRMPASETLITGLTVFLNEKGQIVEIKISGSSGMFDLDEAAVESFNKAGPFPNPPKGMMVNGIAQINWGFVVKV